MSTCPYDAIIVGGGHNGLVCAAYLAKAGLNTLVLERRHIVGGACTTEEFFPGYRFSACAYYCGLLQKEIIEDLQLRRHGFHVYQLDPAACYLFPDGRSLLLWDSMEQTQDAIAKFSRHDAKAFPGWVAFWKRAARLVHPYFLTPPPTIAEIGSKVRGTADEPLLDLLLAASMDDIAREYFEDKAVQGALTRGSDVGDPTAPGSAWCGAYVACGGLNPPENVGIVKGGMGAITQAMAAAAREYGAALETGATVERILVERGKAIGVRLADGSEIRSRVVVSNADPKRTFLRLLNSADLPVEFVERVGRLKCKVGSLKLHVALDRLPDFSRYFSDADDDSLVRHVAFTKVSPSIEYLEKSWDDAKHGRLSRRPVMHVQIPSGYDSTMAPEGRHAVSVWTKYAPVRPKEASWHERRDEAGEQLITALAEYLPDLRKCITRWQLFTPLDMEERVGLTDGNIRHLDLVPTQYLASRPLLGWADYRTPVKGLYLCGAGAHPGGDVNGAPGHNAAKAILVDRCGS